MQFQEFLSKINKLNNWDLLDSGEGFKFLESKPTSEAACIAETKKSLFIFVVARDAFIAKQDGIVYTTYGAGGLQCGKILAQVEEVTVASTEEIIETSAQEVTEEIQEEEKTKTIRGKK